MGLRRRDGVVAIARPFGRPLNASLLAVVAAASVVRAADYTLFTPAPSDHLRALNSDRPTQTEGAFTVDPGHVQVESSFLEYARDDSGDPGVTQFSILPSEFRVGLTEHTEADLIVQPLIYQRRSSNGRHDYADSFGDTTARVKINFVGDDGGPVCAGLIPFVTAPTANSESGIGTGYVTGGLILPVQLNLPKDVQLAGMIEVDADRSGDNRRYGEALVESIVIAKSFGRVGPYAEFYGLSPRQLGERYQAYVDGGATVAINDNVQLDVGVNVGVSRASRGYTLLTGITVRR